MKRHLGVALLVCLFAAGASVAHAGTGGKPVTWQFDFGYSMVQGKPGDVFEDGWTIGFGGVARPWPKKPLGIRWDFTYDWWDVNTGELQSGPGIIDIDDGDGDQWSVRTGLQYESQGDKIKFAGGVGIGGYRLSADISQDVVVPGWICDPYYWWYCYPGLVSGEAVLADKTLTKFGYYATAGIVFPLSSSDIYVEVQYHWVNVEKYFETVPIVVGWRF